MKSTCNYVLYADIQNNYYSCFFYGSTLIMAINLLTANGWKRFILQYLNIYLIT